MEESCRLTESKEGILVVHRTDEEEASVDTSILVVEERKVGAASALLLIDI